MTVDARGSAKNGHTDLVSLCQFPGCNLRATWEYSPRAVSGYGYDNWYASCTGHRESVRRDMRERPNTLTARRYVKGEYKQWSQLGGGWC